MKAASSLETGAAFAAFCVNFRFLLGEHGLCLVVDDVELQEAQMYRDTFSLYEAAVKVYFDNLSYRNLDLSPETRERWQNGVMTAKLGDQDRPRVLPEGCRAFFEYARDFFPMFFSGVFGIDQTQVPTDQTLAMVLTELALGAFANFFAREAAVFLPASSDMRQCVVVH